MWNIFKFFFVWFWLGVATWVICVEVDPPSHPHFELVRGKRVAAPQYPGGAVYGLGLGFLMCIPSYFIARPKGERSGESHYAA